MKQKKGQNEKIILEHYQLTKVDTNRRKNKQQRDKNNQKAIDKMSVVSPDMSIITLHVNEYSAAFG